MVASKSSKAGSYTFLQDGKLTAWLALSTISATVGASLQFGYGTGVMSAPTTVSLLNQFLNPPG